MINVDFPPPDTPVTQVRSPSGIVAEAFFRLLPLAPTISSLRTGSGVRRGRKLATSRAPVRYWPVRDAGSAMISAGVPCDTISPPWMPAPGPTSTT
jgi:hypothetical protein